MKIILKEYLASLRERGDLDHAVLPNLLSELGLTVLNTPMIGTRQNGVDIAAVGKIRGEDDKKCLYLFCIKAGNISRNDWSASPQSVYQELNQIRDVYIRSNVSSEHTDLPIKICLCCGGELEETILMDWAGYTENYSSNKINFELWNGDRLAEYMMKVFLARELLEDDLRSNFQKAVATVTEPSTCYAYAFRFLKALLSLEFDNIKQRLFKLRQAYICIHTINGWAIEAGNLESIYTISELGLLLSWDVIRKEKIPNRRTKHYNELVTIQLQFIHLYIQMSEKYFRKTTYPYADKLHALSVAVKSREPVDVNLAMFELVGRLAIRGIWANRLAKLIQDENEETTKHLTDLIQKSIDTIVDVINNNPILNSPLKDDHMIEMALIMMLAQQTNMVDRFLGWLHNVGILTSGALLTNGPYPTCIRDYADLLSHPVDASEDYRKEACAGSILYPFLFLWLHNINKESDIATFVSRLSDSIPDCTHQAWLPDEKTDDQLWSGGTNHGVCIIGLNPKIGREKMSEALNNAYDKYNAISEISAMKRNLYPLLLTACRHYRMPVPPTFWFSGPLSLFR
ncbi:MAG: hypothetical protein V6Z81_03285 [Parvularculales bacterium]